ncbi:V-type ATP synthase subunit A [Coriobacteriia bacterium Es71-Z0120]|uniref:V-type ATP synthase subunit A n=1 Tax=Parvivirga hydrogeniphila TaxID=2939460 RepID=UPI0022609B63|nr:V-type ATP synthase subunit A [Parvivirga hydrogeniphila]MCL4079478.1 V-type ATP synthase subunit A [Parvivirga hydrogeniphila]
MEQGRIIKVAGPLVVAEGLVESKMYDLVRVGDEGLMGEIIEMRGDRASIQVYEETEGLGPGDPVVSTGAPLSVELGPGMLEQVYDGVQRPLDVLQAQAGAFIARGLSAPALDRKRLWAFEPRVKAGDAVAGGDVIGVVQENVVIEHRIMVPPHLAGEIVEVREGEHTVTDTVARLRAVDGTVHDLTMMQVWPVRVPRPYREKLSAFEPLVTGTRVIDTFFPVVKGGVACIPGPFGAGKTVTQHQIAKWSNAEIVVFIGCGERGNEMTDVLMEFPELTDPYSGQPLMKRTVLVANTSNMPVAAREASVYTGITMAEYFRDMGYNVVLQADSTSRWAEAMREISGRLEEMPGDEGFPAYLGTRLASFYERAGKVRSLGSDEREGSVTVVGSVSPPGGDLSEPVVQNTLRVVKVFWALQDQLAFQRHFPAIDWLTSYSLYLDKVTPFWAERVSPEFRARRDEAMAILQREAELAEIVRLVGVEALSPEERVLMETAKSIREDFLQQNAFRDDDQFSSLAEQDALLRVILLFRDKALEALSRGAALDAIFSAPVRERIARAKYLSAEDLAEFDAIASEIETQLVGGEEEDRASVYAGGER